MIVPTAHGQALAHPIARLPDASPEQAFAHYVHEGIATAAAYADTIGLLKPAGARASAIVRSRSTEAFDIAQHNDAEAARLLPQAFDEEIHGTLRDAKQADIIELIPLLEDQAERQMLWTRSLRYPNVGPKYLAALAHTLRAMPENEQALLARPLFERVAKLPEPARSAALETIIIDSRALSTQASAQSTDRTAMLAVVGHVSLFPQSFHDPQLFVRNAINVGPLARKVDQAVLDAQSTRVASKNAERSNLQAIVKKSMARAPGVSGVLSRYAEAVNYHDASQEQQFIKTDLRSVVAKEHQAVARLQQQLRHPALHAKDAFMLALRLPARQAALATATHFLDRPSELFWRHASNEPVPAALDASDIRTMWRDDIRSRANGAYYDQLESAYAARGLHPETAGDPAPPATISSEPSPAISNRDMYLFTTLQNALDQAELENWALSRPTLHTHVPPVLAEIQQHFKPEELAP